MANILEFLPLRYTYSSGILSKNGSKRALHHLHGARIPWRTRCSITASSIEAYHDSEPAISTRRSANYQPSSWSHVLAESMDEKDNEWEIQMTILKKLEEEVRYMLDDENLEPQSLLELVHDIDRLGISYKYRGTIRDAPDRLKSLKEATTEITKDLHLSALYFRLLRQHGYEASPDIFERFRDRSGNFGNLGRSLAKDVRGILSLYEASHLAYEGEDTLQEAKSFTSLHLKSSKELVDSNMSEEIKHALELPYHHRMRRLEARWNIETCAKRNGKNQILLELAKLDFNKVQSVLQGDLQDVLR
ncbi:unnamed protein product [Coffea canephora]|uniref:Terpene synthase N-terminal domain-containing protein n=1 Tax=Coffea canephora TaxID=49390 RepID=A0A068UTU6_COFCA|nr:unnamed protein product [Coffea canephora]